MPLVFPPASPLPPRGPRWRGLGRTVLVLAVATLIGACGSTALPTGVRATAGGEGPLHVPSPDWRDQVIYFALTDRFDDGDPSNNDQGRGEFRAGDRTRYNGGDLQGLRRRLDYIQGLGATALWITPPVANQWLDPTGGYAGYHGYWTEHFKRVDPHLGTLQDYQALSRALHGRGMYLVQDVVVNHTGNYFSYGPDWNPADPARGYLSHDRSPPVPRPSQPPFDQNDPRDPAHRQAGIYHWTPDIRNYADPQQEANFQLSGLDDLNTENPVVRRALRDSFGHWIREAGVDAFRLDTAFYVPPAFLRDFLQAGDPQAPGVLEVARRTGRQAFHVFGEGFTFDRPYADEQSRKIERYMNGPDGQPVLPGMINFPLYGALGDVLARGRPTAELGWRIGALERLHPRAHLMPTFVDNHDVDRFLAGGSVAALRQALLSIFTLPGIPTVYYGTEQGFTQPRAAMFAAGYGSGGRDRFDTSAPLYRTLAALAGLRREHRLFSRGWPTVLHQSRAGPGALAWRMSHEGEAALVVLNTADRETLVDALDTGLPAGALLQGLLQLDDGSAAPGRAPDLVVGAGGRVHLALPPRAGLVWRAVPGQGARGEVAPVAQVSLDSPADRAGDAAVFEGDFTVGGRVTGAGEVRVAVDGNLASAQTATLAPDGRWSARVDTAALIDPAVRHRVVAFVPPGALGVQAVAAASPALDFRVARRWTPAFVHEDPAGDDLGPAGRYRYPTDPSWGPHRPMDLRRVAAWTAGGALRLDLTLDDITTTWNPQNGFDHVAFTVFIELPGQPGGSTVMPGQNATLPDGMRWHRRLRVGGWMNALFSSEGASAQAEGKPVGPAAAVEVDAAARTVRLTLAGAALGGLGSLAGARVYVNTWDYDGGYRALAPQPQAHGLGGGDGRTDPLVMDDTPVLVIR